MKQLVAVRLLRSAKKQLTLLTAYLGSLIVDDLLGCQITLVANQQLVHILVGISVNLIQPLLHIVEAVLVCNIIDHLQ